MTKPLSLEDIHKQILKLEKRVTKVEKQEPEVDFFADPTAENLDDPNLIEDDSTFV